MSEQYFLVRKLCPGKEVVTGEWKRVYLGEVE